MNNDKFIEYNQYSSSDIFYTFGLNDCFESPIGGGFLPSPLSLFWQFLDMWPMPWHL
jgi:hypothetical protein